MRHYQERKLTFPSTDHNGCQSISASQQPSVIFFGKESEQDGPSAAFISRLPDREGKLSAADLDGRLEEE